MQRLCGPSLVCVLISAAGLVQATGAHAQANGIAETATPFQLEREAKLTVAEAVIAREEAASERAFDPRFRSQVKNALAGLPMAGLESQQGGLGLNSLGDSQADLVYTPVTPCRIIDTRLAGGPITAGFTRSLKVTGDTTSQGGTNCGVPFGPATSAMINFVAVGATAPGDLRVTPFGTAMPVASILNWAGGVAGLNLANGLAVALCNPGTTTCTNDITLQADGSTIDIVADVQGYFRKTPALSVDAVLANTVLGQSALGANTTGGWNSAFGKAALGANTTGNYNSAFGSAALALNTTGVQNSAFGQAALVFNTTGSYNSAFGDAALFYNTTGARNSAFGEAALMSNTTGSDNVAFGDQALLANTTADRNSAFGQSALSSNTTGSSNSAYGFAALLSNTTASENVAFGDQALLANTTGGANSAFGRAALRSNTTGYFNTAVGRLVLSANTTGRNNAGFGAEALRDSTTAELNTAVGDHALTFNTTGSANTAVGANTLSLLTTGEWNTAIGEGALGPLVWGSRNTALGIMAGYALTGGNDNVYISTQGVATSESGTIRIGTVGTHTTAYIAGISGVTSASGVAVYVNSNGQLGTTTSSARFKDAIRGMDAESDVLMKLRPVAFYYKPAYDNTHTRQYGLLAEEVAQVAPELVVYDEKGAPQTVRYHFVNAMLLNEVQKQRRENAEQKTTIAKLEERLARLEAVLAGDR